MSLNLSDLFRMSEWKPEQLASTELHLVSDLCADDGWTTVPHGDEVLTCERCAALVLHDSAVTHLDWHRRIEKED